MLGPGPEERVGTVIGGRYRVERVIGQGGMGVVFAGTHQLTDRKVAIKIILPHFAQSPEVLARFFQEAKTAAALSHPNVVDTLDMGVMPDTGEPFLVLELLDGTDLAHLVADRGRLEPAELLPIVLPVLDALVAAHERGIIHRDLKPENLFIGHDARGRPVPKLLDFGIAKLTEGDTRVKTQTGGILGTPQYMSPEQAMASGSVGPPSDVWAMGALLYECLAGERAYDGDNPTEVLVSICTVDPRPIRAVCPEVDAAFAAVVHRALQRKLEDRYTTAEELGAALLAAAASTGVAVPASIAGLFAETRERIGDDVLIRPAPRATGPIEAEDVKLPLPPATDASSIEPPPPKRSRVGLGLWLGLLALLSTALLVLGVWWMARPVEPALPEAPAEAVSSDEPDLPSGVEAPSPEPEPRAPTRRVDSDPTGAEIFERGIRLGVTPMDLAIDPDSDRLIELRRDGYEIREVSIGASSAPVSVVALPSHRGRLRGRRGRAPALVPR